MHLNFASHHDIPYLTDLATAAKHCFFYCIAIFQLEITPRKCCHCNNIYNISKLQSHDLTLLSQLCAVKIFTSNKQCVNWDMLDYGTCAIKCEIVM